MGRSLLVPLRSVDFTLKYEDTSSRSSCADTLFVDFTGWPREFLVLRSPDIRSGVIGAFVLETSVVSRRKNPSIALVSCTFAAMSWAQSVGIVSPRVFDFIFIIAARSSKSGGEISTMSPPSNLLRSRSSRRAIS